MVKRFLVTTSLEETWSKNKPTLFLGEWCRRYSRKEYWSNIDAEVLPYHWDDRAKLYKDYLYLDGFYEQLLQDLTVQLNQIHSIDHSLRYWRIVIGPWLGYFIQVLFDRWSSIQDAIKKHEITGTIICVNDAKSMVPNDMVEFIGFIVDDKWNHNIYAEILQKYTDVPLEVKKTNDDVTNAFCNKSASVKSSIKNKLSSWYVKAMHFFVKNEDAFFLSTCIPLFDEFRLAIRLRQAPQKWRSIPTVITQAKINQRNWDISRVGSTSFEACARALISQYMPTAYLEGYSHLLEQVQELPWPKSPKLIWTSNACTSDDVFKVWAAGKVETGAPLVLGQHGGQYGVARWMFNEKHEITICDRYMSWGWKSSDSKVKRIGQLKVSQPLNVDHAKKTKALLVTTIVPRYSYWMFSAMVSRQYLDYFEEQCDFVEKLPDKIQDALIVRLHSNDYGWDQEERWRDRFSNLHIDVGKKNINELIRQSRLYICTFNATAFLEAFAMNIPTVIYWDPKYWELRDSALPYFDELKEVGIFHESAESAAQHVTEIWDDVDAWWGCGEVSSTVKRFCEQYAYLPSDYLKQIEHLFKDVVNEHNPDILYRSNVS